MVIKIAKLYILNGYFFLRFLEPASEMLARCIKLAKLTTDSLSQIRLTVQTEED